MAAHKAAFPPPTTITFLDNAHPSAWLSATVCSCTQDRNRSLGEVRVAGPADHDRSRSRCRRDGGRPVLAGGSDQSDGRGWSTAAATRCAMAHRRRSAHNRVDNGPVRSPARPQIWGQMTSASGLFLRVDGRGRIPGGTEPESHQTPPGSSPTATSAGLNKDSSDRIHSGRQMLWEIRSSLASAGPVERADPHVGSTTGQPACFRPRRLRSAWSAACPSTR